MVDVAAVADNGTAPGRRIHFWCPGCAEAHGVVVDTPDAWTWNESVESPTFSPSVKVTGVQWNPGNVFYKPGHKSEPGKEIICHSYVRDGRIEFLGDCTHELAGQTVDLPPWPYI